MCPSPVPCSSAALPVLYTVLPSHTTKLSISNMSNSAWECIINALSQLPLLDIWQILVTVFYPMGGKVNLYVSCFSQAVQAFFHFSVDACLWLLLFFYMLIIHASLVIMDYRLARVSWPLLVMRHNLFRCTFLNSNSKGSCATTLACGGVCWEAKRLWTT